MPGNVKICSSHTVTIDILWSMEQPNSHSMFEHLPHVNYAGRMLLGMHAGRQKIELMEYCLVISLGSLRHNGARFTYAHCAALGNYCSCICVVYLAIGFVVYVFLLE